MAQQYGGAQRFADYRLARYAGTATRSVLTVQHRVSTEETPRSYRETRLFRSVLGLSLHSGMRTIQRTSEQKCARVRHRHAASDVV